MRRFEGLTPDAESWLLQRGPTEDAKVLEVAQKIIADVRSRGMASLIDNAQRYDASNLTWLGVSDEEWAMGDLLSKKEKAALELAASRIRDFHTRQLNAFTHGLTERRGGYEWDHVSEDRSLVGQRWTPLQSVGVYVPGGKACYPSSVLMNVIPAQVAGVQRVVVATPARSDGALHPAVVFCLKLCCITDIIKVGGAAAVAGLAYVSGVDKIVGPGNSYVNAAKRLVWGHVGVDGFAGPSEVCVIADDSAHVHHVAVDFLTQIEHAGDNAGFIIAMGAETADRIQAEVDKLIDEAPRGGVMREAVAQSALFVARDQEEAIRLCNLIAPEHLALAVVQPEGWVPRIRNAGCIMLGTYTPESAGDYVVGPSHTLPTSRAARFGSPLSVLDFMKVQSLQMLSEPGLNGLADAIELIGHLEGLPMHSYGGRSRQ